MTESSLRNIHLIDINQEYLSFSWNISYLPQIFSDTVVYNIIASNCGTCPNSTTSLSATCVDFIADGSVCSFALQTAICGNSNGPITDPIMILLKRIYTVDNKV